MKIHVGADHRGFELKKIVLTHLAEKGFEPVDAGTYQAGVDCDYPGISRTVAVAVAQSKGTAKGILLCMSGIGHSIAANKVPGAYAALVYNEQAAALSRQHNDSNILVLGSLFMSQETMKAIIDIWLATPFEGGRHARRTSHVKAIETEFMK